MTILMYKMPLISQASGIFYLYFFLFFLINDRRMKNTEQLFTWYQHFDVRMLALKKLIQNTEFQRKNPSFQKIDVSLKLKSPFDRIQYIRS